MRKNLDQLLSSDEYSDHAEKLKEIIHKDGKKIVIDWNKLSEIQKSGRRDYLFDNAIFLLRDLGLLTKKVDGNYIIMRGVINVGPGPFGYFFTRESDAKGYAETFHQGTNYKINNFRVIHSETGD